MTYDIWFVWHFCQFPTVSYYPGGTVQTFLSAVYPRGIYVVTVKQTTTVADNLLYEFSTFPIIFLPCSSRARDWKRKTRSLLRFTIHWRAALSDALRRTEQKESLPSEGCHTTSSVRLINRFWKIPSNRDALHFSFHSILFVRRLPESEYHAHSVTKPSDPSRRISDCFFVLAKCQDSRIFMHLGNKTTIFLHLHLRL